jgi:putative transposase
MMDLIEEAVSAGACKARSCEVLGISVRTLQRWQHRPEDGRPTAIRPEPAHKLTEAV